MDSSSHLRKNIQDQINRLMSQMEDLEAEKDGLSKEEYDEMYEETISEMTVFQKQMESMLSGNMTLLNEFQAAQMAMQAAISKAFQTPEVIRMFANKNHDQLRQKLASLQRDVTLGKITEANLLQQKMEILSALNKLNEKLSPEEEAYLEKHKSASMEAFESTTSQLVSLLLDNLLTSAGQNSTSSLLNTAATNIKNSRKISGTH